MKEWWSDPANIAELLRWLVATGAFARDDFEDLADIVERPWRWTPEYEEMRSEHLQEQ